MYIHIFLQSIIVHMENMNTEDSLASNVYIQVIFKNHCSGVRNWFRNRRLIGCTTLHQANALTREPSNMLWFRRATSTFSRGWFFCRKTVSNGSSLHCCRFMLLWTTRCTLTPPYAFTGDPRSGIQRIHGSYYAQFHRVAVYRWPPIILNLKWVCTVGEERRHSGPLWRPQRRRHISVFFFGFMYEARKMGKPTRKTISSDNTVVPREVEPSRENTGRMIVST